MSLDWWVNYIWNEFIHTSFRLNSKQQTANMMMEWHTMNQQVEFCFRKRIKFSWLKGAESLMWWFCNKLVCYIPLSGWLADNVIWNLLISQSTDFIYNKTYVPECTESVWYGSSSRKGDALDDKFAIRTFREREKNKFKEIMTTNTTARDRRD